MNSRVTIGMLVYNSEKYLGEALDSLLGQTFRDFRVVASDDGSTDGSFAILRDYARRDPRVTVERNPQRRGYIANYAATFARRDAHAPYFAWAADHDRYEPAWLETLVRALDSDPAAVLAYPLTRRIGPDGEDLDIPCHRFDTSGLTPAERVAALAQRGKGFGNMIYGLMRADAIARAGGFPACVVGDNVLLWQLALDGSFRQVEETLFNRRFGPAQAPVERQRRMAFARAPWYLGLPWPLVGAAVIARRAAFRPHGLELARAYWEKYKKRIHEETAKPVAAMTEKSR